MITEQQLRAFNFVDRFIHENGVAPTLREISAGCGWKNTGSAHQHLSSLERMGYIARSLRYKVRCFRILKRPEQKTSTRKRAA